MPIGDIRQLKTRLRAKYRAIRTEMTAEQREHCDSRIAERVRRLWQYRRARQVLTYVSTPIEVDTRRIIAQALADGKRVAVPRCIPDTRQMEFYYISSLDELSPGSFGVDEPQPLPENLVTDLSEGLCIIPAFCYDHTGYRLGYGKGYYDRFLPRFGGNLIGICYSSCVRRHLPHGRFDRPAELLVTENYLRRTDRGIATKGGTNDG
ncbi:MAG: 5-formyltetrahydrofolate cyclo-ligase [Clostridia bacterium]|nr:5-formyltetrahydrofolate cyclo-ligase [Clostridia bacterium]